jgi:hypothetical protein
VLDGREFTVEADRGCDRYDVVYVDTHERLECHEMTFEATVMRRIPPCVLTRAALLEWIERFQIIDQLFGATTRQGREGAAPPEWSAAMRKLRIVTGGTLGGRGAHAAVPPRPPISLDMIVARTHMYTYAAKFWGCPSFKGHFLSRRAKT